MNSTWRSWREKGHSRHPSCASACCPAFRENGSLSAELLGRLDAERIDVALTLIRPGVDRFPTQSIIEEGYGIAMADSHRLAGRAVVAAEELASETMIVRRHCEALSATSRYFVDRGVRPHFALRSTNDERVMQMVAAGLGITVMPETYRWPGMALVALKDFHERRNVGFLYGARAAGLRESPVLRAIETSLKA